MGGQGPILALLHRNLEGRLPPPCPIACSTPAYIVTLHQSLTRPCTAKIENLPMVPASCTCGWEFDPYTFLFSVPPLISENFNSISAYLGSSIIKKIFTRSVLRQSNNAKKVLAAGTLPRTPLGDFAMLPDHSRPPTMPLASLSRRL